MRIVDHGEAPDVITPRRVDLQSCSRYEVLMELGPGSLSFIEQMYARYLEDPTSVDEDWQKLFSDQANGAPPGALQLGPSFSARSIFNAKGGSKAPAPAPAKDPSAPVPS